MPNKLLTPDQFEKDIGRITRQCERKHGLKRDALAQAIMSAINKKIKKKPID